MEKVLAKNLVDIIALNSGTKKKDAKKFLDTFIAVVKDSMVDGVDVTLPSFFKIFTAFVSSKIMRNPRTREKVSVPGRMVARCRFSKNFLAELNSEE